LEVCPPETVPALLRAALTGDEAGVFVLLADRDPLPVIFALMAWASQMRGGGDFGSPAEWDDYLEQVQRAMRAEAGSGR
jgi:hypothetical protein